MQNTVTKFKCWINGVGISWENANMSFHQATNVNVKFLLHPVRNKWGSKKKKIQPIVVLTLGTSLKQTLDESRVKDETVIWDHMVNEERVKKNPQDVYISKQSWMTEIRKIKQSVSATIHSPELVSIHTKPRSGEISTNK